jgi:peptidyl-prolyl cis-trans isomerase D
MDPAQLLTAAFQAKQNGAPQMAATGSGYAIFDVKDIQPAHAPAFDAFKGTLLNDFRASKVPELLDKKTAELADRAKVDNNLDKAAKELGATIKTSDLVGQDGQVPDLGAMSSQPQLFALGTGQISGPITSAAGGFVVQITEKQAPTEQDLNMKFEEARDKLLNQRRDEMFGVFVSDLQKRYENEKRIAYNKQAQQTPGAPSQPGRPS